MRGGYVACSANVLNRRVMSPVCSGASSAREFRSRSVVDARRFVTRRRRSWRPLEPRPRWGQLQSQPRKQDRIAGAKDTDGKLRTNRSEMAEVFAQFYEALYSSEAVGENDMLLSDSDPEAVDVQEIRKHIDAMLKKMKKNK